MSTSESMSRATTQVILVPSEMIKLVPLFDGDKRHLNLYIRKCEYIISRYAGNQSQNIYLMHTLTSRLIGDAAALLSERNDIDTWAELKQLLMRHFGDPRNEQCIAIELESLQIKQNESFLDFCHRIQSIRSVLISKVNEIEDAQIKASKVIIYNNTALNVFLYNLPEHLVRSVRLHSPTTLEDALAIVMEEVNFNTQYSMRSKLMSFHNNRPNSLQNFKSPTTNSVPYAQTSAPKPISFVPKPMPAINSKPSFGFNPPTFGYRPQFNNPQFGYNPRLNAQQFGYRPQTNSQSFGYNPRLNAQQFGYRPQINNQPFGYRPQLGQQQPSLNMRPPQRVNNNLDTDVSMRTALPAKVQQGFKLNELYNDTDMYEQNNDFNIETDYTSFHSPYDFCYEPYYNDFELTHNEYENVDHSEPTTSPVKELEQTENLTGQGQTNENFYIKASTKQKK